MCTYLITKNHEKHNNVGVVKVAEVIRRIASERVKDRLDSFSALSHEAFQFTLPASKINSRGKKRFWPSVRSKTETRKETTEMMSSRQSHTKELRFCVYSTDLNT